MTVKPANRAPVVSTAIPDQKIERRSGSGVTVELPLGDYFSDADEDTLTYTVSTTSGQNVVWAGFHPTRPATTLSLVSMSTEAPNDSGTTTVTVTATDTDSESVSDSFSVTTSIRPNTVGTIASPFSVTRGATSFITNVPNYFSDDDGDTLTYSVSSSDTSQMTVGLSQNQQTLSISGSDHANVTVTLTATDPMGLTASYVFNAIVGSPPTTVGTMPGKTTRVGWGNFSVNASSYFSEPDGDTLSYSASSSNTNIARIESVSGSTVIVTPSGTGNATITVTASDPGRFKRKPNLHYLC